MYRSGMHPGMQTAQGEYMLAASSEGIDSNHWKRLGFFESHGARLSPPPRRETEGVKEDSDAVYKHKTVSNGVDSSPLGVQRRMRAELGRLLVPLYSAGSEAMMRALGADNAAGQSVPVKGIEKPLFFLKHEKPEAADAETRSRSNPHEAKFVAALAAYLVRQGYAPAQLTILTPYCGQQLLIKRELHEHAATAGVADVLVSGVEQYQGESNDIVLLSLVRSNEQRQIGMLSVEHRVADALSRARHGLYIVGNASLLGAESKLWESVLRVLKRDDAIGDFLPLLATRGETGRCALARSADDFVDIATDYERQQKEKQRK